MLFGILRFEVTGGPDGQRLVLDFPRRTATREPLDHIRQVIGCYWGGLARGILSRIGSSTFGDTYIRAMLAQYPYSTASLAAPLVSYGA